MEKIHITSRDVAALAGVSQAAVSRSFTVGASVAEATKKKVMAAATQLGYRPNIHARNLITGRTRIVGVVLAHLDNLFYPRFLQILSEQLQANGMQVLLFITDDQNNDALLDQLLQYRVDGIVLGATTLSSTLGTACTKAGIPVVMFNRVTAENSENAFHSVRTDEAEGGRQIAKHLMAGGHHRIAYVAGKQDSSTNQAREHGFLSQLRAQGQTLFAYGHGDYLPQQAARVVRDWFVNDQGRLHELSDCPDAIFAANDQMALAVIDTVRYELGLDVPEQVSVVGFDDAPQAQSLAYTLTTYAQPLPEMVDAVLQLLNRQLSTTTKEKLTRKGEALVLPGRLVARQSSRAPQKEPETYRFTQKNHFEG